MKIIVWTKIAYHKIYVINTNNEQEDIVNIVGRKHLFSFYSQQIA